MYKKYCWLHSWRYMKECEFCKQDRANERPSRSPQEAVDQLACSQETQPPSVVQGLRESPDRKGLSDQSAASTLKRVKRVLQELEQQTFDAFMAAEDGEAEIMCNGVNVGVKLALDRIRLMLAEESNTAESKEANVVAAD